MHAIPVVTQGSVYYRRQHHHHFRHHHHHYRVVMVFLVCRLQAKVGLSCVLQLCALPSRTQGVCERVKDLPAPPVWDIWTSSHSVCCVASRYFSLFHYSTYQNELRRQQLRRPMTSGVEQSSYWTACIVGYSSLLGHVQKQTKDIFVYCVAIYEANFLRSYATEMYFCWQTQGCRVELKY